MNGRSRSNPHRRRLAYEAARIMEDLGVQAFDRARRKAAERAAIGDRRLWPSNEEIQEALLQQRRLFGGEKQDRDVRSLREQALAAMHAFSRFVPRLTGPALTGSATNTFGVHLHLFSDNPEDVVHTLLNRGIPWHESEKDFRYAGGIRRRHPVFSIFAGETPFELVVLPLGAQRNPPLDPVSERPERGASTAEVARLLDTLP